MFFPSHPPIHPPTPEQAIEDLRVKYAIINAEKERAEAAAAAVAASAEREAAAAAPQDLLVVDDDPELEALRKSRMASLKSKSAAVAHARFVGFGELREIVEADFLKEVTSASRVVVFFFHVEFPTCDVMLAHLRPLAAAHPGTKFVKLNAAKAPFFVGKLRVTVLPSLVFFEDGVAVGRQTGLDGLVAAVPRGAPASAGLSFPTGRLERVLAASGVLGGPAKAAALVPEDASEEEDDEGEGQHRFAGGIRILRGKGGGTGEEERG